MWFELSNIVILSWRRYNDRELNVFWDLQQKLFWKDKVYVFGMVISTIIFGWSREMIA